MDKNKSIDGLAVRSQKATVSSSNIPAKRTTKKTVAKPKATKPKSIPRKTTRASVPKSTPRKTTKPTPVAATPTPTPEPSSDATKNTAEPNANADFLSPTQVFNFDEDSGELQASAKSPSPTPHPATSAKPAKPTKPKKEKKKMSKKRKIILSIVLTILLLLIAATTCFIIWGNDIIAKITGGQGNVFDLLTFLDDHYEPLKTDANGRTNILAFGTSGYNMNGDEGNGTHDGAQLTDSIMVISLDQETGDLAMLSLPRDLKVSSTCTATSKINEIYWCNGGSGDATTEKEAAAAEALMDKVGDILGLDFQYFAHLNWASLIQIVNTLDGIEVTLDEGIYDYNYTGAVFEPGVPYTINGDQALGLARARHGTTSGDFSRGASQQKILIGIKNKLLSKNLSITELTDLAGTLGDNLRTNFNIEELKTLAHLTSSFDFDAMRQVSLLEPEALMTTGTINGISYVLPTGGANYYTRIQAYVDKMFSSNPLDYEDATVLVLNGTDTPGVASTEQSTLEEVGYQNVDIDDAPTGEYTEKYTLYSLTDDKPGTKKLLEEHYSTTSKPLADLPDGINQSYDFVIIIGNTSENQ